MAGGYNTKQDRIFSEIISQCDGMLAQQVYRRIYEAGRTGGLIVEVGTALGAATTALALGLTESERGGHIYSFDPMLGGPRRSLSGVEARVLRARRNLARFGVADRATIVPTTLADGLHHLPGGATIDVLMLDADGMIDRDLMLLRDRLAPDCLLIIDDVADKVRVRGRGRTYGVDSKMRLSFLLVGLMKRSGVISEGEKINDTYFGRWNGDAPGLLAASPLLDAYRELVFQSGPRDRLMQLRDLVTRALTSRLPTLSARLRSLYRQRRQFRQT